MNISPTTPVLLETAARPAARLAGTGRRWLAGAGLALACCLAPTGLSAQVLPGLPAGLFDGRLALSGDASVSYATDDHDSYFNYGSYEYDNMRVVRLGVKATLRTGPYVSVVASIRGEAETPGRQWRAYPVTLVVRVQPLGTTVLTISAGIVQPVFGAFNQRRYGTDNPLIGHPLAYQYTTAVRGDALPVSADQVAANRARGWAPHYPIGDGRGVSGLTLYDTTGWSPGVQLSTERRGVRADLAVTRGSLATPGNLDRHGGWEVSGRVEVRPAIGLVIGTSAARGSYLDERLAPIVATAVHNEDPRETAVGADVEYSHGYWIVRAETLAVWRTYPAFQAPYLERPLSAVSVDVEAKYTILPGLYAAARVGHLSFGTIDTTSGSVSWDAPVSRVEVGGGWFLSRDVLVKLTGQYNHRDSARQRSLGLVAAQLVLRF